MNKSHINLPFEKDLEDMINKNCIRKIYDKQEHLITNKLASKIYMSENAYLQVASLHL